MSLIPTRSDQPGAQAELDLATLLRARAVVAGHRPVHRSIAVLARPAEEVLADLDAAIAAQARLVGIEATSWLRDGATAPSGIGVHAWADVLARHGWTGEVAEVLGDAGRYLPWMRFDVIDGCNTELTLPEVMLAEHAAEIVGADR